MPFQNDALLMQQISQGNQKTSRIIVEKNLQKLLSLTNHFLQDNAEAEDVVQETFLKLWKIAPKWKPKAAISTWLYRVTLNEIFARTRKKSPAPTDPSILDKLYPHPHSPQKIDPLKPNATLKMMHIAFKQLTPREQACLLLFYFEKKSILQIANILLTSPTAAESFLRRTRKKLKTRILTNSPKL